MNHDKGMRAKSRGSKKLRGEAAATATSGRSATTTSPTTSRGDASKTIGSRSVKRPHD